MTTTTTMIARHTATDDAGRRRRNNSRLGFDRPGSLSPHRDAPQSASSPWVGWAEPSRAERTGLGIDNRRLFLRVVARWYTNVVVAYRYRSVGRADHRVARPSSSPLLILQPDRLRGPVLSRSLLVAMATASSLSSYQIRFRRSAVCSRITMDKICRRRTSVILGGRIPGEEGRCGDGAGSMTSRLMLTMSRTRRGQCI